MNAEFLLRVGKRHRLVLATKRTAWSMAELFGLRRLHDYLLGSSTLSDQPVWIMGVCFQNATESVEGVLDEKVLAALVAHFKSLMYLSYRHGFSPKNLGDWTSDVGWGCTIRTGQMMMAQALLDHLKDARFRRGHNGHVSSAEIASVVSLFWDDASPDHTFSIHHICHAAMKYGMGPGCWMGPGFVCRLLAEINNLHHPFGLHVELIAHPDGAPFLTPSKIQQFVEMLSADSWHSIKKGENKTIEENPTGDELGKDSIEKTTRSCHSGLVLLIPLVLGTSRIDDRYLTQLKQILTWVQSIGFIGGRSNSSMYFVGHQEDNFFYLDPHRPQAATSHPTEMTTYFNAPLKHMHMSSLVTSLSLGFYCKSLDELHDLLNKLRVLEKNSNGAPILSFVEDGSIGEPLDLSVSEDSSTEIDPAEADAYDSGAFDEWELI